MVITKRAITMVLIIGTIIMIIMIIIKIAMIKMIIIIVIMIDCSSLKIHGQPWSQAVYNSGKASVQARSGQI